MRKRRFVEAQIISMAKEQEAGLPTSDLCRKRDLSRQPSTSRRPILAGWRFRTPSARSGLRMRMRS